MEITLDVLLQNKSRLEAEILALQQDITAKDGALQLIEGLMVYLEKEDVKHE